MRVRSRVGELLRRLAAPRTLLRELSEPVDDLTRLANAYGTDKGTAFAGRHHYTRVYSALFEPLRASPVRLLEIGLLHVQGEWDSPELRDSGRAAGGQAPSLRMWADYFPRGEIFGLDINDFSGVRHDRCTIFRGDASDRGDLAALRRAVGDGFDIVIDDASHASNHQQIALASLFPAVKPGGLYVIEDLDFQRPELEPEGAVRTLDVLKRAECTGEFRSPFMAEAETAYLGRHVGDISFFDSLSPGRALQAADAMAVIRKSAVR